MRKVQHEDFGSWFVMSGAPWKSGGAGSGLAAWNLGFLFHQVYLPGRSRYNPRYLSLALNSDRAVSTVLGGRHSQYLCRSVVIPGRIETTFTLPHACTSQHLLCWSLALERRDLDSEHIRREIRRFQGPDEAPCQALPPARPAQRALPNFPLLPLQSVERPLKQRQICSLTLNVD